LTLSDILSTKWLHIENQRCWEDIAENMTGPICLLPEQGSQQCKKPVMLMGEHYSLGQIHPQTGVSAMQEASNVNARALFTAPNMPTTWTEVSAMQEASNVNARALFTAPNMPTAWTGVSAMQEASNVDGRTLLVVPYLPLAVCIMQKIMQSAILQKQG
jgi:hypothetical protein